MEELSDRFRSKVLKQLLLQSPASLCRASGRTALPSAASGETTNWLLTSTFTPCCNSLKKSQVNSRHFHTVFPGIPQIFSNWYIIWGWVLRAWVVFCQVVILKLHLRLERGLLAYSTGFPFIEIFTDNPKSTPRAALLLNEFQSILWPF